VAGVGKQREGMGGDPIERLGGDEDDVERDADREGAAEAGGCVHVPRGPVTMIMRGMIMFVMVVRMAAGHAARSGATTA